MVEKSSFAKPLSLAFREKASGVFGRPKLQRRAFTAHAASELLSAATLTNALLELRTDEKPEVQVNGSKEPELGNCGEQLNTMELVLSPRLRATTWHGSGHSTPGKVKEHSTEQRRSTDVMPATPNPDDKSLDETAKEQTIQATFRGLKVKKMIKEILNSHLEKLDKYDHRVCDEKGRQISQAIEKNIKSLNCSQFKITALVFIGAIRDKGIDMTSQCTWSPGTDYFAMATFKTETIFASGIVFATAFE